MSKLIILNGASGAGKTFLLEKISHAHEKMAPVKKLTTRTPREYEGANTSEDLIFNCDEKEIDNCKYNYSFNNEGYGIMEKDIEGALKNQKYPVVIVRDYPTIIALKKQYKSLTFYIQSVYNVNELKMRLINQGRNKVDVSKSIEKNKKNFDDYIKYLRQDIFDRIIVNYYDDTFMQQVEYFLEKDIQI